MSLLFTYGKNRVSHDVAHICMTFYLLIESNLHILKVEEEPDEYDGTETEDYWFFCNQWFARSEGDKQIVRELIPTDEQGRPFRGGLEGRSHWK